MRILKTHPLLKLANSYIIDSPQPSNLSYMWNFGSLLAVCLIIQIATGVTLAMHYNPSIAEAFNSVEHIMRDVNNGWLIRYLHSNTASAFFFLVYLHIGRGLYYGSYRAPRTLVWAIGTIILIIMILTGFLGYVLPYGQMSLWGATVITNLMSAIPWLGQDIVELTNHTNLYFYTLLLSSLPVIGIVHINALKKLKSNTLNKEEYLTIPTSFIAFLVGIIDGDGYIQITRTGKGFITMKLTVSLHIEDLSTLEYIKSVLKLGKINVYRDIKNPTCKLVINRTNLQLVLFPLLLHHKIYFLTNTRIDQFNLAMFILNNDIKLFDSIPSKKDIPLVFNLPKTSLEYKNLFFFKNWIVGFTMAEGSFFMKKNLDGCFQLKQKLHLNLFEAFKLIFETNRKISIEKELYNQFGVSSKSDVQKVINFFSFFGLHPLIGLKGINYFKWLNDLKNSKRYNDLNFPNV
jgi:hypothetical protein